MQRLSARDYHVGWICALSSELAAAKAMLDEEHQMIPGKHARDSNNYVLGRIHDHNIVLTFLSAGVDGTNAAAVAATDMVRTFPAMKFGFMVGIGAGVPDIENGVDIRLGDIVISQPEGTNGGVVQYDKGKSLPGGVFNVKGSLNSPPRILLTALRALQAEHDLKEPLLVDYIREVLGKYPRMVQSGYGFPGGAKDLLHCDQCITPDQSCKICQSGIVKRTARTDETPSIHYGTIASGNQVVRDAVTRRMIKDLTQAKCIEMEAAGLMNDFPCLIIRGVCDYADSFKNDQWHKYAAITAAAYTKELLLHVTSGAIGDEKSIHDVLGVPPRLAADYLKASLTHLGQFSAFNDKNEARREREEREKCHQALKTSSYEEFKDLNPDRDADTCEWVLKHPKYLEWLNCERDTLLWISADPGCGKSVLARSLLERELKSSPSHTACYFFFKDNVQQEKLGTALCAILHQLFSSQPSLIAHALPCWRKNGEKMREEVTELWRILLTASADLAALNTTIVLDALDECQERDRERLVQFLTKFYITASAMTLHSRKKSKLKFLVTSRPYLKIEADFNDIPPHLPSIRLIGEREHDQLRQEIDRVIDRKVCKLANDLKLASDVKNKIHRQLVGMENRTYLWLQLVIATMYQTYRSSLRPLEETFEVLPNSVEAMYEKILSKVSERSHDIVKKILLIVIGARTPLTVSEMAVALGIATSSPGLSLQEARLDPNLVKSRLSDWSGLFVSISNGTIHLIHQTAREFLVNKSSHGPVLQGWKYCLTEPEIENTMTQICIQYLESYNRHLAKKSSMTFVDVLHEYAQLQRQTDDFLKKSHQSIIKLCDGDQSDNASQQFQCYSASDFLSYANLYWQNHLESSELWRNGDLMSSLSPLCLHSSSIYHRIADSLHMSTRHKQWT